MPKSVTGYPAVGITKPRASLSKGWEQRCHPGECDSCGHRRATTVSGYGCRELVYTQTLGGVCFSFASPRGAVRSEKSTRGQERG